MQKHPLQMRPRQFVPPLFVGALLLSLAAAPFSFIFGAWFALPCGLTAGSYALANFVASASITARRRDWSLFLLLPIAFAILHVSFGLGFLVGLLKFRNRWGDHDNLGANNVDRNI
jgi:vacuolar-type H+-ATPase subunit I/STV1